MEDFNGKRIALVRLTAMGDVIHTAASLQFVKAAFPDLRLSWFVEEKFAGILEGHPDIDTLIPLDLHRLKKDRSPSGISTLYRRIRAAGPFDLVIDVQGLIKSAIVARIAGGDVAGLDRSSAREGVASLLYRRRYPVDCAGIAPMRFASLIAQSLGITITPEMMAAKASCLPVDPDVLPADAETLFDPTRKNILLVTGASNASKTYPPELWVEVVRGLDVHNVLLIAGSEAERRDAETIAASTHARLLPPLSLPALKAAVARGDLLLGGDTGPSHLAWALNRPSLLLFGSTPRSMMFETPINRALSSGAPVHPCRFDKSDRSIADIRPETIVANAENLLDAAVSLTKASSGSSHSTL